MSTVQETVSVPRYGNLEIRACQLVDLLKSGQPGDQITDERLSAVVGQDTRPGGSAYPSLGSAIRYVAKNFAVVWKRIPKAEAIRCLTAPEIVNQGRASVGSIRRRARRTIEQLAAVDYSKLPPEEQKEARAVSAQVATVAMFAGTDTTKKLAARSAETAPDPSRILELWK